MAPMVTWADRQDRQERLKSPHVHGARHQPHQPVPDRHARHGGRQLCRHGRVPVRTHRARGAGPGDQPAHRPDRGPPVREGRAQPGPRRSGRASGLLRRPGADRARLRPARAPERGARSLHLLAAHPRRPGDDHLARRPGGLVPGCRPAEGLRHAGLQRLGAPVSSKTSSRAMAGSMWLPSRPSSSTRRPNSATNRRWACWASTRACSPPTPGTRE